MPKRRKHIDPPPPDDPEQLRPEVLASYPGLVRLQRQLVGRRPPAPFALLPVELPAEVQKGYQHHRQQQYQRALDGPPLSLPRWRRLELRRDRLLSMAVYRRYLRREAAAGRIDRQRAWPTDRIDRAIGQPAAIAAAVAGIHTMMMGASAQVQPSADTPVQSSPPEAAVSEPVPVESSPPNAHGPTRRRSKPPRRIAAVQNFRRALPEVFHPDFPHESANLPEVLKGWKFERLWSVLALADRPSRSLLQKMRAQDVDQWWLPAEDSA